MVAITRAKLSTRIPCYAARFRRQITICNSPSSARTQLFDRLYACLGMFNPSESTPLTDMDQILLQMIYKL